MTEGLKTIIYPVKDLAKAKAFYAALLGVKPVVDSAPYVGFDIAGQHVGLVPGGDGVGADGPVGYWHVGDIRQSLKTLTDAGAVVQQDVRAVGGGRLVAAVKDADGNVIGLIQDQAAAPG